MTNAVQIDYRVTLPAEDLVTILDKWIPELGSTLKTSIRPMVQARFRRRIRNWQHRISFSSKYERRGRVVLGAIHIFPAQPQEAVNIWRWVSRGTGLWGPRSKKYPIRAKRAPYLKFRGHYIPHTSPSGGYGLPGGGRKSGPLRIEKEVMHPGIESRHFEEYVQDEIKEEVYKRLLKSFDDTIDTHYGKQRTIP